MIANASMDIWALEGVGPIVKYEDYIDIFCFPTSGGVQPDGSFVPYLYAYDHTEALHRISLLCIPWHPDKGQDFGVCFTYIGFFWSIVNKEVSLLEAKCLKFLS